ncbi:glycerate dehydrogenase [Rhizobium leguminosarum]|uniref:NAD(P)-dependent oxidoreductase n=1 Tax=Rhizobium leguminosarum TaxID=384 RepID=UPI001C95471B|nr:NAD(P)-dependent oxidoreductase [Rhizobium leguminosarum]MBY5571627.1 glycerate dehydrogenase [Rhizobium leguminosarum]MBY5578657.1 glycerate dehydrogenase [Rhizobium leguminosarum]
MKALFVDCTKEFGLVIRERKLHVPDDITINYGSPSEQELISMCCDANVLFTEHTVLTKAVLDACPFMRAIVFMGTGASTYVDLDDAKKRGVEVLTTPGYGDRAVAEHACALMFAAARRVATMDRQIRAGEWLPTGGLQLAGEKIAIIGLGGIGATMARLASSIGMKVAGWNRTPRDEPWFVGDIDEALADAMVVSVHLTLTEETRGILGARRLGLPAKGFILVNTARAALVDERALIAGLAEGKVGHAALDVFPEEPLAFRNPYILLDNATLTAHAAYMTTAAYEELWRRTLLAFERLQTEEAQQK